MARATLRSQRLNDQIIDELRASIADGVPWHQQAPGSERRGYADLIFLESGLFYPITDFIHDKNDFETVIELWSELREDFLREHIKHKPGTRPWAWWREDREQLEPGETQYHYLKRHKLLLPAEKKEPKRN